jgi:hypothetical protein
MPMETLNTLQFPILGPDIFAYLFCHFLHFWIQGDSDRFGQSLGV